MKVQQPPKYAKERICSYIDFKINTKHCTLLLLLLENNVKLFLDAWHMRTKFALHKQCIIGQREQRAIINFRWNKPHQSFLVNLGLQITKMLGIQVNFGVNRSFQVIKLSLNGFLKKIVPGGLIFVSLVCNYSPTLARKIKFSQMISNHQHQSHNNFDLMITLF